MEFTLLWAALTAVVSAWVALRLWPSHIPERAPDRLLAATLFGLVTGRLTAMLAAGVNPITNLGDFIIIRGGVSTAAASGGFVGFLLWAGRGRPYVSDGVAPAALAGLAGWHMGCIWRGACLGTASELPWAWAQQGSLVTRHPVEIYAAIGFVLAAYLVSRCGPAPWLRTGLALGLAAFIRLATEPMRPSITGGPVWWYVAGMAIGAGMIVASVMIRRGAQTAPT